MIFCDAGDGSGATYVSSIVLGHPRWTRSTLLCVFFFLLVFMRSFLSIAGVLHLCPSFVSKYPSLSFYFLFYFSRLIFRISRMHCGMFRVCIFVTIVVVLVDVFKKDSVELYLYQL